MTNNPLMAFQPHERVYVSLPTLGKFYDSSVIDLSEGTDVGVRPMSAKDEMMFNNPDALMNGKAVSSVLKNCVPSVKNASALAVADVEALLLGIKLASNERTYDINTKCPNCDKEGSFSRDIDHLLQTVTHHEDEYTYDLNNGLVVYLCPNSWISHSKLQQVAFRQQRLVQVAQDPNLADTQKQEIFNTVFNEMIELNMDMVCDCISYIDAPSGKVDNHKFIREYVETLSKQQVKELSDLVEEINSIGVSHEMEAMCPECDHEWTIEGLRFDPSYFFV